MMRILCVDHIVRVQKQLWAVAPFYSNLYAVDSVPKMMLFDWANQEERLQREIHEVQSEQNDWRWA
jgi:hypothetical protein